MIVTLMQMQYSIKHIISLLLFILYRSLFKLFSHIGSSVFFLPELRLRRRSSSSTIDRLIMGRGRLPGVIVCSAGRR